MARNAQKEFLIGQSSRSHATLPAISGWLLVKFAVSISFWNTLMQCYVPALTYLT